jgi:hypothetical protein
MTVLLYAVASSVCFVVVLGRVTTLSVQMQRMISPFFPSFSHHGMFFNPVHRLSFCFWHYTTVLSLVLRVWTSWWNISD